MALYCKFCDRKPFLNLNLCKEHWHITNDLPQCFNNFKERSMRDILTNFLFCELNILPVWNRSLPHFRYRPDLQFTTYHKRLVIVEIDEHMHRYYTKDEERTKNIRKMYPDCIFIRINVDAYKSHPAIWSKEQTVNIPKNQIITTINTNQEELDRRIAKIKKCLVYILSPNCMEKEIRLFYSPSKKVPRKI